MSVRAILGSQLATLIERAVRSLERIAVACETLADRAEELEVEQRNQGRCNGECACGN